MQLEEEENVFDISTGSNRPLEYKYTIKVYEGKGIRHLVE